MNAVLEGGAAAVEFAPRMKVGVWVDCPFTKIDKSYARRLRSLGITEACLMVNVMNTTPSSAPWKLRGSHGAITTTARILREVGLDVVLTCWPRPSRSQLDELLADMAELMRTTKAVALEVDCEANWTPRFLEGFETMDEAARALVETLRTAAAGARVEMTTFPLHAENGAKAQIAPLVDAVFPQAYSVNERSNKPVPWDHPFGPGNMQALTLEHARKTGAPVIGLGLAAYEQRWAGHTREEAMGVAVKRARELGVRHVRYWSSKWIVGAHGQPWARSAIAAAGA
jgi:hypothetical protein